MAAVLLLSGVQLIILGLIGEYLGRLYLTANGKPQSVVREVRRSHPSLSAGTSEGPATGERLTLSSATIFGLASG
jgi:hypothetical protein